MPLPSNQVLYMLLQLHNSIVNVGERTQAEQHNNPTAVFLLVKCYFYAQTEISFKLSNISLNYQIKVLHILKFIVLFAYKY